MPPERQRESVSPASPPLGGWAGTKTGPQAIWPSCWGGGILGAAGVAEVRSWDPVHQPDLAPGTDSPAALGTEAGGVIAGSVEEPEAGLLPRPGAGCWASAPSAQSQGQDRWALATTMSQLSQTQPFHTAKMSPQPTEKQAPSPLPPETSFPQLTAEPLCPASPRSPGMPTSPYTQEGTEGVSGLHTHGSRGKGLQILTGTPGSPEGPASPSSPGLPCGGGMNPECLPAGEGPFCPQDPDCRLRLPLPIPWRKQPHTSSPFSPLDPARPGRPCRSEVSTQGQRQSTLRVRGPAASLALMQRPHIHPCSG